MNADSTGTPFNESSSNTPQKKRIRGAKSGGGRGSKEATAKRRAARQLNAILDPKPIGRGDGRTEKRRKRLIKELIEGRRRIPLKPIDMVANTHELMMMGETATSLMERGVVFRKTELSEEVSQVVLDTQKAYGFRPEAWVALGLNLKEDGSVQVAVPSLKKTEAY